MKKKKSKFLTFCFSFLPGAGHMYMGFMKMGISLMSVFFFLIFISSWLDVGPLLFVLPLIWFYSFFDCINKRYSTDEEFSLLEDKYLFSFDELIKIDKGIFKKYRFVSGIILIFIGCYFIGNNILNRLNAYIPSQIYNVIRDISRIAPQMIVGTLIIVIGAKLIMGKKSECDNND